MNRPIRHVTIFSTILLSTSAVADTIVQSGYLSGYPGQVEYFDIPLQQFDTQGGALQLNFIQLDFLTAIIGGGTSNGEGGRPTHIDVLLTADYSLNGQLLGTTHAEISLTVHHNNPPMPFTFYDADEAHVTLTAPADLAPWIGAGEVVMNAEVLFLFEETPPGSANASAGGSVDYSVTYDYGPAGSDPNTIIEDFEDLANEYGWSWGTGGESVVALNGNPGAHLEDATLVSAHPVLYLDPGAATDFTGDYRQRNITSLGVDLIVKDSDFPIGSRLLTLLLTNDAGTPGYYEDDLWAWHVGDKEVPQAGEPGLDEQPPGWTDYVFAIPSQSQTVPQDWQIWEMPGMTPDEVWNGIMTDVSTVEFWYGEPGTYYLVNSWTVGADNFRITCCEEPVVPGDLNGDGIVDHEDLVILVRSFGPCAGCPADLNGDGIVDKHDLRMLLGMMHTQFPHAQL